MIEIKWVEMVKVLRLLFLLISLFLLGRISSIAVAELALAPAYWFNGVLSGLCIGGVAGFLFWIFRVSSPDFSLVSATFLFLVILIFTQVDFYNDCKHRYGIELKETDGGSEKTADELDRLFVEYLKENVEHSTILWFDNLRVYSSRGVLSYEREGSGKYGGSKNAWVERQGFWIWWGWFLIYLFIAAGCFFSTFGAALVEDEKRLKESRFAKDVYDKLEEALMAKGLSREEIKDILNVPQKIPVSSEGVKNFLPECKDDLTVKIAMDLQRIQSFSNDSNNLSFLDNYELGIVTENSRKLYKRDLSGEDKLYAHDLFLLASTRLKNDQPDKSFYECMKCIESIGQYFSVSVTVPPFKFLNLEGIDFKLCESDDMWSSLLNGEDSFYKRDSVWTLLEEMDESEIPEDAYLAIIHQWFHQPDQRVYEMWQGKTPSDLMKVLAPKMRDAILTYFLKYGCRQHLSHLYRYESLFSFAAFWPREQGEEIFVRCIESGWRAALNRVPETKEWESFLLKNKDTPFGPLYVDWFVKKGEKD